MLVWLHFMISFVIIIDVTNVITHSLTEKISFVKEKNMLRVFVDSGSSIKQNEKELYGVEIIPLRYLMGDREYEDGIDMTMEEFYHQLIDEKLFPKTSLPYLDKLETAVKAYTEQGDDIIIITISSGISGTYSAFKTLFEGNEKVTVIDSLSAVGGIKILVYEINQNRNLPVPQIVEKINALIPRIRIAAIPETLNYLMKGGRLSKAEWLFGGLLDIKPVITLKEGKVKVLEKKRGLRKTMKWIADYFMQTVCTDYPVYAAYTYRDDNLKTLISMTDEKYHANMFFEDLDPVVACHWGPNAFGFIYVE